MPRITPSAIPVRAECPIASLKKDILFETTEVPSIPKMGQATSTARNAFFMKTGEHHSKGKRKSSAE